MLTLSTPTVLMGFLTSSVVLSTGVMVQAQSITSVGDGTVVRVDGDQIHISGGTQAGTNLFHSFGEFNLDTAQIADFEANATIDHILGRITGGNGSVIDGLLRVSGSDASLYLMNPAGIVFGANAQLDVLGSFTATTATGIGINDHWFNAYGANEYDLLVGTPNRFGFGQANPGAIVNQGHLAVMGNHSLNLVAGAISNQGTLSAEAGQVVLATVQEAGLVRLSQVGHVLSLEVDNLGTDLPNSPDLATGIRATDLPVLLTEGRLPPEVQLVEGADGTMRITSAPGYSVNGGLVRAEQVLVNTRTLVNGGAIQAIGSTGSTGGHIGMDLAYLVNRGEIGADGAAGDGGEIRVNATARIMQIADGRVSTPG
jgi:filamentous hemagglutinin family protein